MTYIKNDQSNITLTANISDAIYIALSGDNGTVADTTDDNVNKIFIEIKNSGSTSIVNPTPDNVTFPNTVVGSRSIRIASLPIGSVDGIYTIAVKYTEALDADTNGVVTDVAKAIVSKVTVVDTVACL